MRLSRQMWLASLGLALIVGSAFAALVFAVAAQRAATEREDRSKDAIAATLRLEKLVADIETGVRGYAFTRNTTFLERINGAKEQLDEQYRALERVAAGADQRRVAAVLIDEIRRYIDEYADPIVNLVRAGSPADVLAAQQGDVAGEGDNRSAVIRDVVDEFMSQEEEQTLAAAEAADEREQLAFVIGGVGLVGSTLLIVLFGIVLARSVARPVRTVASGATSLAAGDLGVRLAEKGSREVRELTQAFNTMAERLQAGRQELEEQNEKLRESERMKTELISIVSHELRTPLASVLGFTSLLLKREFDSTTRRHYLGIVDAQARRLSALLEDFLDVQRMEQTGLELSEEKVDLASLLAEQAQLYAAQSPSHQLELEVEEQPLAVRGDPNRLAQVVGNLLSNAIKYSDEGSRVELAAARHGRAVRMTVRDQGRGIPRDQQERIFTKFFRGDAGATGITGTGLGLAVSREIVEAHGGRIGFDSDPGAGSTFWIELPGEPLESAANHGRSAANDGREER